MKTHFSRKYSLGYTKRKPFLLALFWLTGVSVGVFSALSSECSWILDFSWQRMSIAFRLAALCFPFLITYILITFCNFYFLLPLALSKSFLHTLCIMNLRIAYGSAGWLVSSITLITESFACCLLWLFWYDWLRKGRVAGKTLLLLISCIMIMSCIDYYVISPFTEFLLNY